jgi:hypothetical protein
MHEHLPAHADALSAKRDVAMRLLLATIPQPIPTSGGLISKAPVYSDSVMRRFARVDRAIADPESIVHDAMNGHLSVEARHVLHTVHPGIAAQVRERFMARMAEGWEPSAQHQRVLKQLMVPSGQEDRTQLKRMQSIVAEPPTQQQGAAPRRSTSQSTLSGADRLDQ